MINIKIRISILLFIMFGLSLIPWIKNAMFVIVFIMFAILVYILFLLKNYFYKSKIKIFFLMTLIFLLSLTLILYTFLSYTLEPEGKVYEFDNKVISICYSGLRGKGRVIKVRNKYMPFFQQRLTPEIIGNEKMQEIFLERNGSIIWYINGGKIEIYDLEEDRVIHK